ncbi:major tail protein [Mycobacterium phage Zimmer]|nr:major tail protein [Mycobacterium phage Zimmer]
MAENDEAVLTAAVGYIYVADPGTKPPTPTELKTIDLTQATAWPVGLTAWKSVGHTSRGTLPEFGFDGGDSEVKGSWQKKKLREIQKDDPIDHLTVVLHQFDEESLSLYYGDNASVEAGVFGYSGSGAANEKAGLVIIEDGDLRLGHHFHKAGVKRDDSIDLPIDDLAALPVKFTYLNHNAELLFTWINEDLFNVD